MKSSVNTASHPFLYLLLLPVLFIPCLQILANGLPPSVTMQIQRGMEQTILNDFEGASQTFNALVRSYPDEPFGYFYLGATHQAEMIDAEAYDSLALFDSLMQRTIQLAQAKSASDPGALFYEGSAYLYLGFMDGKLKRMWNSLQNARKGTARLEKLIEQDSTFYDAYLGVGSFKYWKSSRARAFTWLPFLSDERDLGMRMVERAVESGELVGRVGSDQLAWIYLDAGKYDEALNIALTNFETYPESRFFLWTLVEIYYRSENWELAEKYYLELLGRVTESPDHNRYNETNCLIKLAEIGFATGRWEMANDYALQLLTASRGMAPDIRKRVRNKIDRAVELTEKCRNKISVE